MNTTRTNHRVLVGLAGSTTLIGTLGASVPDAHAVYHTPWTRQNAYDLAATGQGETYLVGSSQWIDDNQMTTAPANSAGVFPLGPGGEKGADCSGYAGKAFASPAYTGIGTNYLYPSTLPWYQGNVDGSVNIALTDSRPLKMDVWVFRRSDGTGHMGLFEGSKNATGMYKVWHASMRSAGITSTDKDGKYFVDNAAKRYKRANW